MSFELRIFGQVYEWSDVFQNNMLCFAPSKITPEISAAIIDQIVCPQKFKGTDVFSSDFSGFPCMFTATLYLGSPPHTFQTVKIIEAVSEFGTYFPKK